MTILVLGGTSQAITITNALKGNVIYSLAGVTPSPKLPNSAYVIKGGFGGVRGLEKFIKDNNIVCVVDATHPYAIGMKSNAQQACKNMEISLLSFARNIWQKKLDSDWTSCIDVEDIVKHIKNIKGNIFVALGAKEADKFSTIQGNVIARMVVDKANNNITTLVDRGPYDLDKEKSLFNQYDFRALICKNSGTKDGYYKIEIAKQKGIPIYMLERPYIEVENTFFDIEEIVKSANTIIIK